MDFVFIRLCYRFNPLELNLGGMVDLVFILWKVCDAGVLAFVDAKNVFHNRNGIVEYTENSDADKQLIITRDKPDGGIDSMEIKNIIEKLFNS